MSAVDDYPVRNVPLCTWCRGRGVLHTKEPCQDCHGTGLRQERLCALCKENWTCGASYCLDCWTKAGD